MNVDIEIEEESWNRLSGLDGILRGALAAALPSGEMRSISVLLTSDAEMQTINREWRGIDKPTNVLSFPSAPLPVPEGEVAHLGDLVLAWQTISREAEAAGKALQDHVSHLVVHGTLHLLGYDHETDSEAAVMEAKETGILAALGIRDPYRQ